MLKFVMTLLLIWSSFGCNNSFGAGVSTVAGGVESVPAAASSDSVPVQVNGVAISKDIIEAGITEQLRESVNGELSPEQLEQYRTLLRPRVIDRLVNVELIRQYAEKAGTALTKQDIDSSIEEIVQLAMKQTGMTREELAKDILKRQGVTIEESLAHYRTNKEFLETILLEKVALFKYPDKVVVSEEEIKDYYDAYKGSRYSKPEMVRASHILIRTTDDEGQPLSEEAIKAAKTKIAEIKTKAEVPGADFAELAREFSESPKDKVKGGDLGFFPRNGAMIEPFAEAAFALKSGQISDIVETRVGYHIIKCTDRQEAEVTSLESVSEEIGKQLARYKKSALLTDFVAELRKEADIKYADPEDDPAVRAEKIKAQREAAQAAFDAQAAEEAAAQAAASAEAANKPAEAK